MSHLWRHFDTRQGFARQNRKCERAYRTLHHGTSHSRATRSQNRASLYSMRLWRASKSRVKDARENRWCDIGLMFLLDVLMSCSFYRYPELLLDLIAYHNTYIYAMVSFSAGSFTFVQYLFYAN